jgi:hypothetical protein
MEHLNLVLKFKVAGDSRLHVKGAARIKVDGRGGLILYDARSGIAETVDLWNLQSFCIQPVAGASQPMPALALA